MSINYLNEYWKEIKDYEGRYQISNYGRVKNVITGKILKTRISKVGYVRISLRIEGKLHTYFVHKLVALAFVPNPHNYSQVNHKDENKLNNFVWVNEDGTIDLEKSNLEWCTPEYNSNYGTRNKRISDDKIGHPFWGERNNSLSMPVLQYDIEGNLIKEWPSLNEIRRSTNYKMSNINSCCLQKPHYNTAYGFIWKYK